MSTLYIMCTSSSSVVNYFLRMWCSLLVSINGESVLIVVVQVCFECIEFKLFSIQISFKTQLFLNYICVFLIYFEDLNWGFAASFKLYGRGWSSTLIIFNTNRDSCCIHSSWNTVSREQSQDAAWSCWDYGP